MKKQLTLVFLVFAVLTNLECMSKTFNPPNGGLFAVEDSIAAIIKKSDSVTLSIISRVGVESFQEKAVNSGFSLDWSIYWRGLGFKVSHMLYDFYNKDFEYNGEKIYADTHSSIVRVDFRWYF